LQDHVAARITELVETVAGDTPILDDERPRLVPLALAATEALPTMLANVWACSIFATAA
jgi:hypothetical protein